ncbi:myosin-binding protein 3 isoform X2 [Ziziphus jujuba]|uniref:Myosin-binding protein 3 isoform X2 n=2 Tax=Ziziphus jujuba TaxID=326968 RepID=A0A6P3ZX91_ZIZJJ|nr:myosin-binding protein 3 isoform X2 [Ziziphus jujuba]KAH7533791.1 hypothetical protein FEM48_Zijuj04G0169300 [Ziziphus jujuba var. spinosa]
MASNRFATMLHRNTHKLILILVYALLEWVLIILLLLNSLFSYLITKFANYFGLKKPCLWCSRVDHILEPGKGTKSYTDLVCESHAMEISQLGYCSNHQKVAESQKMCGNCLASQPNYIGKSTGMTRRMAFISWMNDNRLENDENVFTCSCCNESLSSKNQHPHLLFKSAWESMEYNQKGDLIIEAMDGDDNDNNGGEYLGSIKHDKLPNHSKNIDCEMEINNEEHDDDGDTRIADENRFPSNVHSFSLRETPEEDCLSSASMFICYEKEAMEDNKSSSLDIARQDSNGTEFGTQFSDGSTIHCCSEEDDLVEIIDLSCKDHRIHDLNHRLIPIELIDFSTRADQGLYSLKEEDSVKHSHEDENLHYNSRVGSQLEIAGKAELVIMNKSAEKTGNGEFESSKMEEAAVDKSSLPDGEDREQDLVGKSSEQVFTSQEVQTLSTNVKKVAMENPNNQPAESKEERDAFLDDQTISRTLVSTQVSDCSADQFQEDQSLINNDGAEIYKGPDALMAQNDHGSQHMEKAVVHRETGSVEKNQNGTENLCLLSEDNEPKEEKYPDTPTSVENLHYLEKKQLQFERRESGTKESFYGNVVNQLEGSDVVTTIEALKAALQADRKVLSALYAELEEERSASAIATNQTMAMITRLQEEKAAMQMEALQYQRMMEEQSEYDQEALQLLNDLMVKREKEKQELEKELEVYRKKVVDYEEKESLRMIRRIRDGSVRSGNSSASCSHECYSDHELSIDLNHEGRDGDTMSFNGNQESSNYNTPAAEIINLEEMALDCVKNISVLDDSLVEFEEERTSILDQLKALEERLIKLGVSNELSEDHNDFSSLEDNGFSKDKHYHEEKTLSSMAKSLLPLLDAAGDETDQEGLRYEDNVVEYKSDDQIQVSELDKQKVIKIEEVDHVYERLQALESDSEFLKHCMGSIKQGDKGKDLLQEILQHLRDLKTIELQERNMHRGSLSFGEVPL